MTRIPEWIRKLKNLKKLHENELESLPGETEELKELDISRNQLTSLPLNSKLLMHLFLILSIIRC